MNVLILLNWPKPDVNQLGSRHLITFAHHRDHLWQLANRRRASWARIHTGAEQGFGTLPSTQTYLTGILSRGMRPDCNAMKGKPHVNSVYSRDERNCILDRQR